MIQHTQISDGGFGRRSASRLAASRLAAMALAAVTAATASVGLADTAQAAAAFNALKGSWSGSGTARFSSGESERIRCNARYSGGGSNLHLNLRCASASAQINLRGNLDARGNVVLGDWNESSYNLSGSARGALGANSVRLKISGGANGFLTLNVSGNRHSVAVSTAGSPLTGVNVSMRRR